MTPEPEKSISLGYPIRLNRYLAACGLGARRKVEQFILDGRIRVEGEVECSPGRKLNAPADIRFDGKPVRPLPYIYLVMNKPAGILTAAEDKRDQTVMDLLPERVRRFRPFPVGRLDKDSEGLLILTNDGDCAQKIIHPSSGIIRIYEVEVFPALNPCHVVKWRSGVKINDRKCVPRFVNVLDDGRFRHFQVALNEGLKREVRLMVASFGSRVRYLRRTGIGKLILKDLPTGQICEVTYEKLWMGINSGDTV